MQLPTRSRGERDSLGELEELEPIIVEAVEVSSSNSKWNTIELSYFDSYF